MTSPSLKSLSYPTAEAPDSLVVHDRPVNALGPSVRGGGSWFSWMLVLREIAVALVVTAIMYKFPDFECSGLFVR